MRFDVAGREGRARAGTLHTGHGAVETPVFMPVGTQGTVKAVEHRELKEAGAQIILGNTYHLYLRPGTSVIEQAGGLHRFIGWDRPVLTDSGGYQVFSLNDLRKITDDGVEFRSHLDGSLHRFTPESVVDIQRSLGSDVMMVLDECTAHPCSAAYAHSSNELTLRWAERAQRRAGQTGPRYGHEQALFGIVQGSVYPEIRERSARRLVELEFDGYAVGGLAVGEPEEDLYRMLDVTEPLLPPDRPRYLMGVGTPRNLLEAIERGMDMFDCVLPTRNGRNGMVFTSEGPLNLRNASYKNDFGPVDARCSCYTCSGFSRAYLRHLFQAREILGLQLATIHNLSFYVQLLRTARQSILEGTFASWKQETLRRLSRANGGPESAIL